MNLHTSLQYPFFKFIVEEFSGSFYENELTSLNRILILYHNRYIFSIQTADISKFLDEHQQDLSGPGWLYWYLPRAKRRRIQQVRSRMAYVLEHNRGLIQELLLRRDYSSAEAAVQTLGKVSQWLKTEPSQDSSCGQIDFDSWKTELESLLEQAGQIKKVSRQAVERSHFYQVLAGSDLAEKRERFNRLAGLLVAHRWVAASPEGELYQFQKQHKGGRLYIGALYYVLCEKAHIDKTLDAPQVAALFEGWLAHNFERGSFIKVFQPEEQAQFDCGPGGQRYKYVMEARLLLKDF